MNELLLSAFKEQVVSDKCTLAGRLVGMEFPSLYLVFLDYFGYLLMMVYLYAFIFFHDFPPAIVSINYTLIYINLGNTLKRDVEWHIVEYLEVIFNLLCTGSCNNLVFMLYSIIGKMFLVESILQE